MVCCKAPSLSALSVAADKGVSKVSSLQNRAEDMPLELPLLSPTSGGESRKSMQRPELSTAARGRVALGQVQSAVPKTVGWCISAGEQ